MKDSRSDVKLHNHSLNHINGFVYRNAKKTLVGQAQKGIFDMKKYLKSFVSLKPGHVCNIFDKLIYTILSYGYKTPGTYLERLRLKFCKQILGVKQNRQNDFVYG